MIYPKFLQKHQTIGICAPSAGAGDKVDDLEASIQTFHNHQWKVIETQSVRNINARSNDAQTRGRELTSLFASKDVHYVISAAGGDFLFEILPYIDWNILKENPKWLLGASDPTSALFCYTTKYDVATMYACNATHFSDPTDLYVNTTLSFMKGELHTQHQSEYHAEIADFLPNYNGLDTKTKWKSNLDEIHLDGRCIGGCIDVLKDIIGTPYEDVKGFIQRYKDDGLIWYFDNFSLSADTFYRTLLQMKYAGWFTNTKAIIFGRVLFPSSDTGMSYEDALKLALPNMPYLLETDIGHTNPCFTLMNGAMLQLDYANEKGSITFDLKK